MKKTQNCASQTHAPTIRQDEKTGFPGAPARSQVAANYTQAVMKYLRGQMQAKVFIRGGFYSANTDYDLLGQVTAANGKSVNILRDEWGRMVLHVSPKSFMNHVPHATSNTRNNELVWISPEFESMLPQYGTLEVEFGSPLERRIQTCAGGKALLVLAPYFTFTSLVHAYLRRT